MASWDSLVNQQDTLITEKEAFVTQVNQVIENFNTVSQNLTSIDGTFEQSEDTVLKTVMENNKKIETMISDFISKATTARDSIGNMTNKEIDRLGTEIERLKALAAQEAAENSDENDTVIDNNTEGVPL